MKRIFVIILGLVLISTLLAAQTSDRKKVRIGIAGLTHSHVLPLLRNYKNYDFELVGISESNNELARRYAGQYKIDRNIIFNSLDEMLDKTKPDGVVTFTSIYDHLEVVEACAPRKIHVMVEKPLAVSTSHAKTMSKLAAKLE